MNSQHEDFLDAAMKDDAQDLVEESVEKSLGELEKLLHRRKVRGTPLVYHRSNGDFINPVWIAEYMHQHKVSLDVAMEHASQFMFLLAEQLSDAATLLHHSEPSTKAKLQLFVDKYRYKEGGYGKLDLVTPLTPDDMDEADDGI